MGLTKEQIAERERKKTEALKEELRVQLMEELKSEYKDILLSQVKEELTDELKASIEEEMKAGLKLQTTTSEEINTVEDIRKRKAKLSKIPRDEVVVIHNNKNHEIIYENATCSFNLAEYGDIEYVTYGDLLKMKTGHKGFFTNNVITIEDSENYTSDEIYEALGVSEYYKNDLSQVDLKDIVSLNVSDIEEIVKGLTKGMKATLTEFVFDAYDNGELDSLAKIRLFENLLNISLSNWK